MGIYETLTVLIGTAAVVLQVIGMLKEKNK